MTTETSVTGCANGQVVLQRLDGVVGERVGVALAHGHGRTQLPGNKQRLRCGLVNGPGGLPRILVPGQLQRLSRALPA